MYRLTNEDLVTTTQHPTPPQPQLPQYYNQTTLPALMGMLTIVPLG